MTRFAFVLAAALTCAPYSSAQASGPEVARAHRDRSGARILQDFVALLSIPNVASDTENIRRNAAGDQEVVLAPAMGGSLPLHLFTETLGKPILIVPIANHDDLQHAPDENLRLWNLWYGIDLYAQLLTM